jgi:hypothetical protein
MLIREAEWKVCPTCKRKEHIIKEEAYGCDCCKKIIDLNNGDEYLRVQVFQTGGETSTYYLCSWKCVFKFLKTVKSDYFISLPFLSFKERGKGMAVKDFWKCIK